MNAAGGTRRLTTFYERMSSLDMILGSLAAEHLDTERVQARDLYTRSLDCQNLGMFPMLEVLAGVVAEYGAPVPRTSCLTSAAGPGDRDAGEPRRPDGHSRSKASRPRAAPQQTAHARAELGTTVCAA